MPRMIRGIRKRAIRARTGKNLDGRQFLDRELTTQVHFLFCYGLAKFLLEELRAPGKRMNP